MAVPTTILNARVKQKLATDAYWKSIEDELGIILVGEQAFVYNESGVAVNFKVGDGTKKYSELPFFIAYFNNVTNCKVLSYINQSANLAIPLVFRNQTELSRVIFLNNSGVEQTIKIGTTNGGAEIAEITVPNDIVSLSFDYYFTGAQTLYITGLTGVNYSLFILYYQLDEAPAIPSGGGGGGITTLWAPGTVYGFIPLYGGHTDASWDLISGFGKAGTPYEGAVLFGTNGLPSLNEKYLRGYKSGDTLGGSVGANEKVITFKNLPKMQTTIPANSGGSPGSGGVKFEGLNNNAVNQGVKDGDGNAFTSQDNFNVSPSSVIVLYFTGILTT